MLNISADTELISRQTIHVQLQPPHQKVHELELRLCTGIEQNMSMSKKSRVYHADEVVLLDLFEHVVHASRSRFQV